MTQNSVAEERRQYGAQHFPPYRARRAALSPVLRALPARSMVMTWLVPFLSSAALALELPPIFGDRMVLQADTNVPVWGKAEPGEKVTVAFRGVTLFNKEGCPALGLETTIDKEAK